MKTTLLAIMVEKFFVSLIVVALVLLEAFVLLADGFGMSFAQQVVFCSAPWLCLWSVQGLA